jgi:hypothetical protein
MPERPIGTVLKTVVCKHRGFESHSLRNTRLPCTARSDRAAASEEHEEHDDRENENDCAYADVHGGSFLLMSIVMSRK